MTGRRKNVGEPDETIHAPLTEVALVKMGDLTVGRMIQEPGWRWSVHMKPRVGTEWCQSRHIGYVVSGHLHLDWEDGSSMDVRPGDVFDAPPGHDAMVVGDEPFEALSWEGLRTWATPIGVGDRVLLTVVVTDLVGSTQVAAELGDRVWNDLLAKHNEAVRSAIANHRGREVATTGDGFLATFDGPARAIRFAGEVRDLASALGLAVRVGVHTGEVDVIGHDVRGLAVHEASRIAGVADPGGILASEVTRALASGSGIGFGAPVQHRLKGIEGVRTLYPVSDFA